MTRKEEINNAKTAFYEPVLEDDYYYDPRDCFEEGAKCSDKHPKLSWISVKDDLPCNHEELLINDDKKETKSVLVIINGYIMMSKMYKKRKWYWADNEPTYWFPIPELPKE